MESSAGRPAAACRLNHFKLSSDTSTINRYCYPRILNADSEENLFSPYAHLCQVSGNSISIPSCSKQQEREETHSHDSRNIPLILTCTEHIIACCWLGVLEDQRSSLTSCQLGEVFSHMMNILCSTSCSNEQERLCNSKTQSFWYVWTLEIVTSDAQ